ncbi:hypothetical protein P2318_34410 [Myxococcaceae bacterium GXIMD 01537]
MTSQPGAAYGARGREYCALGYLPQGEEAYYLSFLSDVGGEMEGGKKFCVAPSVLDDPSHPSSLILIRLHTHPTNRRFSDGDLSSGKTWPVRVVDERTSQVRERYLWVLFREKDGECRSYQYNYAQRIVSALREGKWVPIGRVVNEAGRVEMFEGQDWVP